MTRRPAAPRAPGRPDSSAPVGVQMFGWWDVDNPEWYVVVAGWPGRWWCTHAVVTRLEMDSAVSLDALWTRVRERLLGDLEGAR